MAVGRGNVCMNILTSQVPFLILLLTAGYICLGALVFQLLERQSVDRPVDLLALANEFNVSSGIEEEKDDPWSFGSSVLLTFSIITTIGYGHIAPKTLSGRLFCMVYALLGIPIGLLGIANIGRIFSKLTVNALNSVCFYCWKAWFLCRRQYGRNLNFESELYPTKESSDELHPISVIILFAIWVLFGALILPYWEPMTHAEALWFSFISLTTIGFGDFSPTNYPYFVLTYLYIMWGLVFTTMAIDILASYLRKLEYVGKKLTGLGGTKLWFGSEAIETKDLFRGVMSQLPIERAIVDQAIQQLDNLILNTISGDVPDEPDLYSSPETEPEPKVELDMESPKLLRPVLQAFPDYDIEFMDASSVSTYNDEHTATTGITTDSSKRNSPGSR